jgi:carboxypeptidase D
LSIQHSWSISIFIMLFSLLQIGAALGLAASVTASSSPGRNVFDRAEQLRAKAPIIEKREIGKPFEHPRLQKRASPYLNNVTESESLCSAINPVSNSD